MTYSADFRQKVLTIKEQAGLTQAEAAVRFGVGVASIT
ncbi:MAG: transposase, partial [Gammaproteobacteria bacterium]|nr:transposase [Gammaproteobacteria bacterium]